MKNVLQFKITLKYSDPPIWRRIQIPDDYNFDDLHWAIQDVMDWDNDHMHAFKIKDSTFTEEQIKVIKKKNKAEGIYNSFPYLWLSDSEQAYHDGLDSIDYQVVDYLKGNKRMSYIYDFGDNWDHIIEFEKKLPCDPNIKYPLCLDGERASPPDDIGGIYGYYSVLEILEDKEHPEYEDAISWFDEDFDPDKFDPEKVNLKWQSVSVKSEE